MDSQSKAFLTILFLSNRNCLPFHTNFPIEGIPGHFAALGRQTDTVMPFWATTQPWASLVPMLISLRKVA
jgi:hypothetical protein